jgi:hypothetical protein
MAQLSRALVPRPGAPLLARISTLRDFTIRLFMRTFDLIPLVAVSLEVSSRAFLRLPSLPLKEVSEAVLSLQLPSASESCAHSLPFPAIDLLPLSSYSSQRTQSPFAFHPTFRSDAILVQHAETTGPPDGGDPPGGSAAVIDGRAARELVPGLAEPVGDTALFLPRGITVNPTRYLEVRAVPSSATDSTGQMEDRRSRVDGRLEVR